jgi:hypothetical protein
MILLSTIVSDTTQRVMKDAAVANFTTLIFDETNKYKKKR